MRTRLELDAVLRGIAERYPGTRVYYDPPSNTKIEYDCIVYEKSGEDYQHADNLKYIKMNKYTVKVLSKEFDNPICNDICELDFCRFVSRYVSNKIIYDVYELYF